MGVVIPQVTILGTVINFPNSGASPNWSPAVIQFAQQVAAALEIAIGTYDISPQTQNIDADNATTANITNLAFDPTVVRSATIYLSVYRTNTSPSIIVDEANIIEISYDSSRGSGLKWAITQERTGDASISYAISDAGQFSFTTTSIGSGTHTGFLSFSAKALQNE